MGDQGKHRANLLLALASHLLDGEDMVADRHSLRGRRLKSQHVPQVGQGLAVTLRLQRHARNGISIISKGRCWLRVFVMRQDVNSTTDEVSSLLFPHRRLRVPEAFFFCNQSKHQHGQVGRRGGLYWGR